MGSAPAASRLLVNSPPCPMARFQALDLRRHSEKGVTLRLTSATNQCAQKMLLCEVRMKNAVWK
jgi:hypothetical protein